MLTADGRSWGGEKFSGLVKGDQVNCCTHGKGRPVHDTKFND